MLRRRSLRRRNPSRLARRRAKAFGVDGYREWIIWLPCDNCGASPPCDPSHIRTQGAGHGPESVVPHCRVCHQVFHTKGIDTTSRLWEYDLRERPAVYRAHWMALLDADTNDEPVRGLLRRRGDALSQLAVRVIDECFEMVQGLYPIAADLCEPTYPAQALEIEETINRAARFLERGGVDPRTGEALR